MLFTVYLKAQTWTDVKGGKKIYPKPICIYNGKLYTIHCNSSGGDCKLYSFDENKWDSLSTGFFSGAPEVMIEYQGKLICAGNVIKDWGDFDATGVLAWNGTSWDKLDKGGGMISVYCMAVYKNELYVGGNFSQFQSTGSTIVNRIVKWNGTKWSEVNGGVQGFNVNALAVYNNKLYVGGDFSNVGNNNLYAPYIATWDGVKWDSVSSGMDYIVQSFYTDTVENALYVGGGFRWRCA